MRCSRCGRFARVVEPIYVEDQGHDPTAEMVPLYWVVDCTKDGEQRSYRHVYKLG